MQITENLVRMRYSEKDLDEFQFRRLKLNTAELDINHQNVI